MTLYRSSSSRRTTVAKIKHSHTPIHNHLDIAYIIFPIRQSGSAQSQKDPECLPTQRRKKCSPLKYRSSDRRRVLGGLYSFAHNRWIFRYRQFVIFTSVYLRWNSICRFWLAGHPAPLQLAHYLTRPAGKIVLFISPRFLSRSLFFFFRPLLLLFDYLFIASFFQICVLMKI